jgi:hypothetical protein
MCRLAGNIHGLVGRIGAHDNVSRVDAGEVILPTELQRSTL